MIPEIVWKTAIDKRITKAYNASIKDKGVLERYSQAALSFFVRSTLKKSDEGGIYHADDHGFLRNMQ